MEAGVTTATRRLRRASIAGLATIATVGGGLALTGGTAFAALGANEVNVSATPVVFQGATGAATGDVLIGLLNKWNAGDTLTIKLGANSCTTNTGNINLTSTPTVSVTGPDTALWGTTAGATTDTKPAVTPTVGSSSPACTALGVKDEVVLTFNNNSTGTATDAYTVTVGGLKVNVGSTVAVGAVAATVTGSSGTVTTKAGGSANVASVANTKLTAASVVAGAPGSTVAIGTLTAADVTAGTIQGNLVFVLDHGAWAASTTTNGKVTGPTGVTWALAISTTTNANDTLTATPTGTIPTTSANTFALSGASVVLGTAGQTSHVAASATAGAIGGPVAVAVAVNSSRIGGVDRYSTAAQIFDNGPISSNTAVLASGANFPDALSANYLAGQIGTGILLTDPNTLPQATQQALITNAISTVYIIGGTAAVSQSVQSKIEAMHVGNVPTAAFINVVRIGGADRYATNNAVDLFFGATGASNTAVVAVGSKFADALAVGPAIYNSGDVLVLTDGGSLTPSAQSTLVNLGISHVIIVGGTAAVSAAVETSIKGLSGVTVDARIQGADRTQTAAQIAMWETTTGAFAVTGYAGTAGLGFTWGVGNATVNVARGDVFPDALAAGPFAGNNAEVILLTGDPNNLGAGIPAFLGGNSAHLNTVQALGLTAAVSAAQLNATIASSAS
jgi:putative cell wall-binding protein